ncbi:MAG: RIP metalloprotease RseP [Anaerovibrio sp.]|uniref:RIP metalloprotease RseP n=1 Tax=Anaerovibrio sp. TaxID=1872532 RepID=UPI0025BA5FA0|nr:RIP metalloprotease RseP [Anaerovibrio sp.]MBE6100249.1 RIP metalloprotease RseP [Anaerovibrio sp.]
MLLTIVSAVFVFGLLVLVHEWGHFITAKMTNMRVDEFAIGFGPKLISWQKGETLYALRAIPLGGFNRIAGMDLDEEENDAGDRAYFKRPIWARMVVILAGSVMNFVLPVVLFFLIFLCVGVQTPSTEPIVGAVMANRPAASAGLMAGDRITSINGQTINEWANISEIFKDSAGKPFEITYLRGDESRHTTVIPVLDESSNRVVIGIQGSVVSQEVSIGEAASLSVEKTWRIFKAMLEALAMLVTKEGASSELSGPIGVAQMAGEVAQHGFIPLLNFAAFLSLNLGIVNLLPVPALDGGHFITLVIEAVRGKQMSKKAMYYIQAVGVVILMSLMIFATFNDITR